MYALFEKGARTFFEEKLKKKSLTPIVFAIGVRDVLCAAFFLESAYYLKYLTADWNIFISYSP